MSLEKVNQTGLPFYFYCGGNALETPYMRVVPTNMDEGWKMQQYLKDAFVISSDSKFIKGVEDKNKCLYKYYLPNANVFGMIIDNNKVKRYNIFGSRNFNRTYTQERINAAKHVLDYSRTIANTALEISDIDDISYRCGINKVLVAVNR